MNNKLRRNITGLNNEVVEFTQKERYRDELAKQMLLMMKILGTTIDKYQLLDDSYRASGGFEDGQYLIPHPSEGLPKYKRRQRMGYYVNYVKPIVDALVNPIFKTDPVRSGTTDLYNRFIENVDGNDTTLTRFMKKAGIRAKLHGVEFIVMDMKELSEDEVITQDRIIEERIYPYLYLVSPSQISDFALDKFGKLILISYTVNNYVIDSDGNKKSVEETWTWTATKCKRKVGGIEESFINPIGEIPIVPLYGAINNVSDSILVQSDVFAIAKTGFALYQACSELRERNSAQAFSVLTYPIGDDDDYEESAEKLNVGTADMLMYRASQGNRPEFITPPPDSSDMLLNEIEFMVKEIYRMASLRMSTDKNTYNVSAIARKIENQQYYQSIAELAQGLEEVEKKLYKIFNLYMGDNSEGFSISYNREYAVASPEDTLNQATTSLALGMTSAYNKEMRKQVARAVFADIGVDTLNDILDSIEKDPKSGAAQEDTKATVVQPTRN